MDTLEQQRKYAKGLAVREQIIAAACRSYATAGYGACSINDLARAAKVTKNQLYHHFGSKEAIALAAVQRAAEIWQTEIATSARIYPDPQAQLEFMLKRLAELNTGDWPYLRLIASLSVQQESLPAELRGKVVEALTTIGDFLRGRVKQMKRRDSLETTYKARQLAGFLLAALIGGEVLSAAGEETHGHDALAFVFDALRTAYVPDEPGGSAAGLRTGAGR